MPRAYCGALKQARPWDGRERLSTLGGRVDRLHPQGAAVPLSAVLFQLIRLQRWFGRCSLALRLGHVIPPGVVDDFGLPGVSSLWLLILLPRGYVQGRSWFCSDRLPRATKK